MRAGGFGEGSVQQGHGGTGDILRFDGPDGARAELRVTLVDKYDDAMGLFYLTLPRSRWKPGRPVHFEVRGESAGEPTWFMIYREAMTSWVDVRNVPALLRDGEGGCFGGLHIE